MSQLCLTPPPCSPTGFILDIFEFQNYFKNADPLFDQIQTCLNLRKDGGRPLEQASWKTYWKCASTINYQGPNDIRPLCTLSSHTAAQGWTLALYYCFISIGTSSDYFLGSMLPQYMALCVCMLRLCVKKNFRTLLSKLGGWDLKCCLFSQI